MAHRRQPQPQDAHVFFFPGLRVAFTLMAYYRLYVPQLIMRALEVFFSLQSVLLVSLWVLLHTAFLTHPTVCINQPGLLPNMSQFPGTHVLRLSLWFNYTIPLVTIGNSSPYCSRASYQSLMTSFSTCPVSPKGESPQLQNSPSLYRLLVSPDTILLLGQVDQYTDTLMYETEIVKLNQSHYLATTLLESMEFCQYEGVLMLPLAVREQLEIRTHRVDLDYLTAECLQLYMGLVPVASLVGLNEFVMQSFRHLSKDYFNSSGFVQDLRSQETYRFYSAYYDRALLLFAIFPILIIALMSSNLLWFCHVVLHHLLIIVHLTDDHFAPIFISLATLMLIYSIFGIFAVMTGMLNDDGPLCLIVMLAVFSADQYYMLFCNHPVSKRQWPKFFYLFLFVFVTYYLRFNGQLCLYALISCYMLLTLSMVYFMHRWELPLVAQAMRLGGMDVRNNTPQTFRAAYHRYHMLLAQIYTPVHQLIQVEIQVGPVIPPPPPPPVPQAHTPPGH